MNAKTQDFSKMMQDMMAAFPVDASAMQDAFKTSAALGEKMSKVASIGGTTSTRNSKVKAEPMDYQKAMTDFASAQAEATAETMAAFAEVAKKVQMETVELMLAAGKDLSEDASAAVKKATAEVTTAAKKATAAAAAK